MLRPASAVAHRPVPASVQASVAASRSNGSRSTKNASPSGLAFFYARQMLACRRERARDGIDAVSGRLRRPNREHARQLRVQGRMNKVEIFLYAVSGKRYGIGDLTVLNTQFAASVR